MNTVKPKAFYACTTCEECLWPPHELLQGPDGAICMYCAEDMLGHEASRALKRYTPQADQAFFPCCMDYCADERAFMPSDLRLSEYGYICEDCYQNASGDESPQFTALKSLADCGIDKIEKRAA